MGPLYPISYFNLNSVFSPSLNHLTNTGEIRWSNIRTRKKKPKLLEQMRNDIRRKHYSRNTERTYLYWVRQYIYFHHKQHPQTLNSTHIEQFLNHLALNKQTSGTTQSQALNAIVFLYREVLQQEVGDLDYLRKVRTFKNIPTVLSKEEVTQPSQQMRGTTKLMAALLYGAGLRINECITLRVQDIDLSLKTITIRNGKGQQARVILISQKLLKPLERHLLKRKQLHVDDLHQGWGYVDLPFALARKCKNAPTSFQWQYLFPSSTVRPYGDTHEFRRWHTSPRTLQKAIQQAIKAVDLNKRVTAYTLRHTFATHLLESGTDIRTIQELMGHKDVRTTMIYTHVLKKNLRSVTSPFDQL